VHLVGHSRGGFAATRLAIEHPQLVRSVTIVSSGTLSPRVSTNDIALSKCPHPSFTRESARWIYEGYCHDKSAVTDDWMERVFEVLSLPKYRESCKKIIDEQLGARVFLPELARQKRETLQWLREGRLQRPTQIVFGSDYPYRTGIDHVVFNFDPRHAGELIHDDHRAIAEAVIAARPIKARDLMREHVEKIAATYEERTGGSVLDQLIEWR